MHRRFIIRALEMEDAEEASKLSRRVLRSIREECGEEGFPERAIFHESELHSPDYYRIVASEIGKASFVAELDGRLVGIALGRIHGRAGIAHLSWIGVDPKYRGLGIGESLLLTFIDYARSKGCHKVTLYTLPCLRRALRLYLKHGFVPECYLKGHWWNVDYIMFSLRVRRNYG